MRYLRYSEPDADGKQKIVRISVEDAIKRAKLVAEYLNYTYVSDEEALQDFIAVNWASYEDEELLDNSNET
jgi:hypothetical protein